MKVKDIMKKAMIIGKGAVAKEAAGIMYKSKIGSLVVVEGEKVIGIITSTDILGKVVAAGNFNAKVQEIMTKNVITASPSDYLDDAAMILKKYKIKKLPIVEKGKLVGIITATDLIEHADDLKERYLFD